MSSSPAPIEPTDEPGVSPRSERTQAAILDAVQLMIDTFGVKRFRVEDVAAEAGVTRQTITNHFGTKEELLQTWMRREHQTMAEVFLAIAAEGPDLPTGLTRAASEILEFLSTRPSMQPPLRRDLLVYLLAAGSDFPDHFSGLLANGLVELADVDEPTALAAGQIVYRLIDSFASKPTSQVSPAVQAELVSTCVLSILASVNPPVGPST